MENIQTLARDKRGPSAVAFPVAESVEPVGQPDKGTPQPAEQPREVQMAKLLKTVLAHSDMPPCVIVDGAANIVYVHGRTGRYLEPAEGEVSTNLLEMARPGLRPGLINAFRRIASERREITLKKLRIEENGGYCELNLVVRPLPDRETGRRGLMMVIFDEVAGGRKGRPSFACRSAGEKRGSQETRRRPAVHQGKPADHHRGAGNLQRRAEIGQRRAAVHQRGAAKHQ